MKFSYIMSCLLAGALFWGCDKQHVEFGSTQNRFTAIQIQKFDYISRSGTGRIYQGAYSENGDTVYFHVTYYPDQDAPTYSDWQIQGTLYSGARVSPSLAGVVDLSEPLTYTLTAPDGVSKTDVVLKLLIYEVDYAELEKGFGRYNKLFELTAGELGWTNAEQRSIAVVGDELIVSSPGHPFLVYDKRTGAAKNRAIPMPAGQQIYGLFTDEDGILHATSFVSFSSSANATMNIYRWTEGLDQAPELFYQLPTASIPTSGSGGIGLTASVAGKTRGTAQIMLDIDGRGAPERRAVRIPIENGIPSGDIDIFETPVGTVWSGKAIATSSTGRLPYAAVMLGFPASMAYVDNSGPRSFVVDAANSNFLNKIIVGACYFEFNNSRYLACSTISWPGDYRLLIFNIDDPSLITVGKSEPEKYAILNPFMEGASFLSQADAGDVTVQVQPDGKTALVYMMGGGTGIMAFELTNIGAAGN